MIDFTRMTLAVLAGGEIRRTGVPKRQLRLDDEPILQRPLHRRRWPVPTAASSEVRFARSRRERLGAQARVPIGLARRCLEEPQHVGRPQGIHSRCTKMTDARCVQRFGCIGESSSPEGKSRG
jgi:hypothetical protein